jgi:chromosome segregation ATPase
MPNLHLLLFFRWKEESRALSQKFEQTLAEAKGEVTRHKRRSEELQVQLNHVKASKEELNKQLGKMTSTNAALQHQLGEVEARAETATGQVSALIAKEKQLLQERRELHRQLDRMRLQAARTAVK